jgi:RNA-splicing ligase RtcB
MLELQGKYNKDCKIFADEIEPEAYSLINKILNERASEGVPVRIMPDVHVGKDIVVGFTMPLTDMVNPNHIGVDIGCGIISAKLELRGIDIRKSLKEADLAIKKTVPMGMNYNPRFVADKEWNLKEIDSSVYAFSSKMNIPSIEINEQYIEKLIKKTGIDVKIFYKSLGSLGGGNHFIELGTDENDDYWLTIHSGSRNFGLKVANYYINAAKKQHLSSEEYARELDELKNTVEDKRTLPQRIEELKYKHSKGVSKEYLRDNLMKQYMIDMAVAQIYAKINRQTMLNNMCKILGFGIAETIESIHNYISPNDLIIRKGAISAHRDERCIIPFNMKDGLLVCKGKGNEDWNCSAPHGAGRVFSRSAAKANISMKDYKAAMRGIYSSSVNLSTLDESPQAYKNPKLIESLISPTVEIIHRIKPVLNIKASE